MSVPHRHIDIGGLVSVEEIIQHFIGADLAKLNAGFPFDDNKTLHLAGMIMIAPRHSRDGSREAHLSPYPYFHGLDKTAPSVGMLHQTYREMGAHIDIAAEGIEQIGLVTVAQRRDNTLFKIKCAILLEQAESVVSEVEIYAADACLYSPVDGEVSTVVSEVGELVGQGYPVITVLDMNDTWVTFNVKETLLPKIKKGTTLTGYVPALDRNIEMVVDYIAVQAQFATWAATRTQGGFDVRTFEVKARPKTKENDLRPGMSVLVDWNEIAQ